MYAYTLLLVNKPFVIDYFKHFNFLEQFRFTIKLKKKVTEAEPPLLSTSLTRMVHFLPRNEPTLVHRHHPKSIVYLRFVIDF